MDVQSSADSPLIAQFLSAFEKFPSSAAILFSSLIAAFFAYQTIRRNRQLARERNSLSFESNVQHSEHVRESFQTVVALIRNSVSTPITHWAKSENSGTDEAKAIIFTLNVWEGAANAIYHEIYDDQYLFKVYASIVIRLYTFLLPFIRERQIQNPKAYANLDRLALAWIIRKQNDEMNRDLCNELNRLRKDFDKLHCK